MNYFRWVLVIVVSLQLDGAAPSNLELRDNCWGTPPDKRNLAFVNASDDSLSDWELLTPTQTSEAFNQGERRGLEILRAHYPDLFPKPSRGIVLILSDAVISSVTSAAQNIAFCSLSVAAANILSGASTSAALEIVGSSVVGSVAALTAPTALTAFGVSALTLAASNAGREIANNVSEKVSMFVKCTYKQEEWPLVRNAALIALVSPIVGQASVKFEGADAQEMLMRLHQFSGTFRNYEFELFKGSQEHKFIQKEGQEDGGMVYRIIVNLELKIGVKISVNRDQSVVLTNNSLI